MKYIFIFLSILLLLLSLYFNKYYIQKNEKTQKNKNFKINEKMQKNKNYIINQYEKIFKEFNELSIPESNNQTLLKNYYYSLISKYSTKKDLEFKNNPFISIIIPLYKNKKEYILRSLLSIEAQTLKNIEIIYIDDYSQDESIKLLNLLKLIDNRISLVINNKNRGILFSKSLGVKISRGKYVIVADQDDIFLSKILFDTIYKNVEKYNLDILQYNRVKFIEKKNKMIFFPKKKFPNYNSIIVQPILGETKNYLNNSLAFSFNLWDKIIRKNIYIKALNFIGENLYNSKIIQREDHIILFALYKVANRYMRINIDGYLYIRHPNQATHNLNRQKSSLVYDEFTFLDFVYNNTNKNKEEKNIFIREFLKILKLKVCIKVNEDKIKLLVYKICDYSLKLNLKKKKILRFCEKFKKKNEVKKRKKKNNNKKLKKNHKKNI